MTRALSNDLRERVVAAAVDGESCRAVAARFVFSVAVPWVVATNQIRGLFSRKALSNRQNLGA